MDGWLIAFTGITALAVVLQMLILAGMYFSIRKSTERMTQIAEDLHRKMSPILASLTELMEDTQPRLSAIVANAAEISEIARSQANKVDRVFTEAVDRLRLQVIRADQILTGTLESIEEAGAQFRKSVWEPVQQVTALLKGIKTGLEFFRSKKANPGEQRPRTRDEEELFI